MSELESKPKATEPEPTKDKASKDSDKGKDEDKEEELVRLFHNDVVLIICGFLVGRRAAGELTDGVCTPVALPSFC